jgi:hypothetical protein
MYDYLLLLGRSTIEKIDQGQLKVHGASKIEIEIALKSKESQQYLKIVDVGRTVMDDCIVGLHQDGATRF